MPVLLPLSDADYKAKVADPTLASLLKVWEDHTGIVKGRAGAHPPMFDLTTSQKHHFGRLVTCLKLGVPIDHLARARRVEVTTS